jgi:uncharacterized protein (TIGR00299 family) protein
MRVAYIDMIGGAAGDMLMGAWVDAGLDVHALERALRTVVADGWELITERVVRCGIAATHLDLVIPGEDDHAHGHHGGHDHAREHAGHYLRDILAIVERSGLTRRQIERASAIYRRLADAEARVHGSSADDVHFHEVGQIDAILDVAGTCIALDLLGIDEVRCSAFPYGTGLVRMHHGTYPNPGPATVELVRGLPLRAVDIEAELVTTTGAAIVSTLATRAGERVDMTLERVGYGAGRRDFAIPNVVRVLIGEATPAAHASDVHASGEGDDDVVVLEANIDDMSPQHYELAIERVFAAGALDVWLTPIVMKKGRPAITFSAMALPAAEAAVAQTMVRETSTIGVRVRRERRHVLERAIDVVDTPYGAVRFKRVVAADIARRTPEYDDLVRIAREHALPLAEVTRVVLLAAGEAVPV